MSENIFFAIDAAYQKIIAKIGREMKIYTKLNEPEDNKKKNTIENTFAKFNKNKPKKLFTNKIETIIKKLNGKDFFTIYDFWLYVKIASNQEQRKKNRFRII